LEELLRRGLLSQGIDYHTWLKRVTPSWTWDWPHQLYIIEQLERLERGEIRKLMINTPPQHCKSETVTIRYPVYYLDKYPKSRVIVAAYNQQFAEGFSRASRRVAEQAGLSISRERRAVTSWETTAGGSLRAAGVGSGVTGNPGDLILIDDPVKSREEANSEAYRARCWDWYLNDLRTRLQQDGRMILIMTRWHEDDLAGRILTSSEAGEWTVANLPALALEGDPLGRQPGEALCPDRFTREYLESTRELVGSYVFNALYQGRPSPEEGARIKRSWFRYFSIEDDFYVLYQSDGTTRRVKICDCYNFITVDPAATEKQSSDYFVASTWTVTPQRDLLLLDVFRERAETTKHEAILRPIVERYKPQFIGVENRTFGLNIIQRLRVLGYPVIALKADTDKVSRSLTVQARYEAGAVYHRNGAPWLGDIEDELLHFPVGVHDDFVDTASYAGIHLAGYGEYKEPVAKPEPPVRSPEWIEQYMARHDSDNPNTLTEY
jgi:predicted phage terminase large subunit-like protein